MARAVEVEGGGGGGGGGRKAVRFPLGGAPQVCRIAFSSSSFLYRS